MVRFSIVMLVYQGVPTSALPNLVCQPENQRGHKVFLPRKVLIHEMRNITPQLSTQHPQTKDGFPQMRCKHLASLRSFRFSMKSTKWSFLITKTGHVSNPFGSGGIKCLVQHFNMTMLPCWYNFWTLLAQMLLRAAIFTNIYHNHDQIIYIPLYIYNNYIYTRIYIYMVWIHVDYYRHIHIFLYKP